MNKVLYFICEGASEQNFINGALIPYLRAISNKLNLDVDFIAVILRSAKSKYQDKGKGGNVSFNRIIDHIEKFIKQEKQRKCYVTTFIDLYGIQTDFPNYNSVWLQTNCYEKARILENDIYNNFERNNIIPYVQIHEYEALYFADVDGFVNCGDTQLQKIHLKMLSVNDKISNPEEINNGKLTAPSKRIERFLSEINLKYKKPFYAQVYSEKVNVSLLRKKCKHFDEWVDKIIKEVF